MRNRKRKREEEPASARARGPASWPSRPPTPARPSAPPAVAATWPRASAARRSPTRPSSLRPQPLPMDPTRQPFSLFIFSTPTLILPSDRTPTAMAGRARGSRPGHGLAPPLAPCPRNHARPSDGMHASDPPQSLAAECQAPWPSLAIKALALGP